MRPCAFDYTTFSGFFQADQRPDSLGDPPEQWGERPPATTAHRNDLRDKYGTAVLVLGSVAMAGPQVLFGE